MKSYDALQNLRFIRADQACNSALVRALIDWEGLTICLFLFSGTIRRSFSTVAFALISPGP